MQRFPYLTLPMVLVLVGTISNTIGAVWTMYRQNRERAESAEARAEAEKALRQKTEEIAQLNREIAASVTGGDSYPCVRVVGGPMGIGDTPLLTVLNAGRYPLYDVSVRIVDFDLFQEKVEHNPSLRIEDVLAAQKSYQLGNLGASQVHLLERVQLPSDGHAKGFTISLLARNGSVTQALRFRRVNGTWVFAFKVMRDDAHSTVLLESVEPTFPRNPDGSVAW